MRRLLALALTLALSPFALAADDYREVEPAPAPGDKPGIWTLNFRYKTPRIVTVDVPGKGKQQVWYMPFQVYNRTENPQLITPVFELVTKDLNTTHKDEPQPAIFKAVELLEDPTGVLKLKSTINISKEKIPMTKQDSFPRYVSGVAIWTDVPERAAKTNRFSIYVTGLSDGLVVEPPANGTQLVKTKTLQLDFFKPTDDINPRAGDIKPEDNGGLGGERWIYRAASKRKADAETPPKDEKEKKDN
jgi:hypothetical protein